MKNYLFKEKNLISCEIVMDNEICVDRLKTENKYLPNKEKEKKNLRTSLCVYVCVFSGLSMSLIVLEI